MLLAAVIACLGSFSVATAADYAVNSADEFVTAWNQAAASNEASTITITVPSGSDNITLTQEQRAQLNAISGTGNVTVQMADASNQLINFNYDLVNNQVSFNDITLKELPGSDNDIVVANASTTTTIDGRNIELSVKEFELLDYFMSNQGIALTRERILDSVWSYDYFGDARTIDTHVKKLRSKMGAKGDYIKTVWGVGYKFEIQ